MGGITNPTAAITIGPIEMPNRRSPMSAPSATAPIRISRYSGGEMFRPARARSSLRVGRPCTLRLKLRESAAGRSSLSTSSRGVARGVRGATGVSTRSLRTRSRLQKNTAIAAAMGTATARRLTRSMVLGEELRERLLDERQGHPFGRVYVLAVGIGSGASLRIVVVGLERVFERGVGQEPRDELGPALGDDNR